LRLGGNCRGEALLDPEAAVDVAISIDPALDPDLTLDSLLVERPGNARLLRLAAAHPLAEPFDRAGIHPLLTKVLSGNVDLCLLAGAAERDVGVLAVGLPATGEDARGLCGDALRLVDVDGVAQAEVGELRGVDLDLAGLALVGLDRDPVSRMGKRTTGLEPATSSLGSAR
jgi:hypothetical protein